MTFIIFFIFFPIIQLHLQFGFAHPQNGCLRFCQISLGRKSYNSLITENNIILLNPQWCSHIIIDSVDKKGDLNLNSLEAAHRHLQEFNVSQNTKILASVYYNLRFPDQLNPNFTKEEQKILNKFDGFHLSWKQGKFQHTTKFRALSKNLRKDILSFYLQTLRKNFERKLIAVTVGVEYTIDEYFDYKIFNDSVDFIALETGQDIKDLHAQNYFSSRQRIVSPSTWYPKDKISLASLADTWLINGIPKNKLLIYINNVLINDEFRVKTIWSSLNGFAGILLDRVQNFKSVYSKPDEIVDSIKKFEKVQICDSDNVPSKKLSLTCYIAVSFKDFITKDKNEFNECDRIILRDVNIFTNSSMQISKNYELLINYLRSDGNDPNFFATIQMYPMKNLSESYASKTASNIIEFVRKYNLKGIELVYYKEHHKVEIFQELISKLSTEMPNIEIGLQVHVFEVSEPLASMLLNSSWVTHRINSISDVALKIYYQWNKLHELYGLDLGKVVIKIFPGIWSQAAESPYPSVDGNWRFLEKESAQNDQILNRKFLCLNETIKNHTTYDKTLLNLPLISTIHESLEKRNQTLQSLLKSGKFQLEYLFMRKEISTDLEYLRWETPQTAEYKIKIAKKHGFGGVALDSFNDDDTIEFCGPSLFRNLKKLL